MSDSRSAFNRIYYVAGKHPAYPGKLCTFRAWLTINHAKQILWVTRLADVQERDDTATQKSVETSNFALDQPTLTDVRNGSPLTFDQVRVLESYRQLNRRQLAIKEETVYYGQGPRRR